MRQQEVSASVEATGSWAEDRLLQNTLAPACIDYSDRRLSPKYLIKMQMWRVIGGSVRYCVKHLNQGDVNFISLVCLNNVKGQHVYTIVTQAK